MKSILYFTPGSVKWRPAYTNSTGFRQLAQEKEYQLYILFRTLGAHGTLHGIKMVTVREGLDGFVVVDIMLKHSARVSPSIAFRELFCLC